MTVATDRGGMATERIAVRCADQDVHPAHGRRRIVDTDVNR